MPNESRPSGAKAIGSHEDAFAKARIKLTLIYTGILAFILVLSSSIIFSAFSRQLDARFPPRHQMMVEAGLLPGPEEVRSDLILTLVIVNGMLLVGAGVLSYWLADMTLQPIQMAYVQQKEFLGDVSHELRTPLAILQMGLENELEEEQAEQKTRERIKSQKEEVSRMVSLVDDLLRLNRLDSQKEDLDLVPINIKEELRKSVERLKPLAERHQITISSDETREYGVFADPELFDRAVSNIIRNGVLYNHPGGKVEIRTVKLGKRVAVEIEDNGVGLSQEDMSKVFDRFYRVDKSRSRQHGGSGLGLSIVESAMSKMGGDVDMRSELGKGTVVTLYFKALAAS